MRFILLLLFLIIPNISQARYKVEYDKLPSEVRQWYQTRQLTEEANKRIYPNAEVLNSCCGDADVVDTQFRVEKGTNKDTWYYQNKEGNWTKVPEDIIHEDEHAPGGQPILFMREDLEVCFFPPMGAI